MGTPGGTELLRESGGGVTTLPIRWFIMTVGITVCAQERTFFDSAMLACSAAAVYRSAASRESFFRKMQLT